MVKWRKVGVARLSRSGKVVLLAVDEMDPHIWVCVDLEDLMGVILKKRFEAEIYASGEV